MLIKPSWMQDEPDNRTDQQKLEERLDQLMLIVTRIDNNLDQLRNVCFHNAQTTEEFTDRLRKFFENCERK